MEVNEEKSNIVINVRYLDIIITQHNINEAKTHILPKNHNLIKFMKKISIYYKENFVTCPHLLLECKTIIFVLEREIGKHTFNKS